MSKRKAERESETPAKKPASAPQLQTSLFSYFTKTAAAGQESSSSSSSFKKAKPKMVFVARHPSSYGIHLYSPSEIENCRGENMKEFRKFWNEKAVEFCSDVTITSKLQDNRAAIEGAIYSSWTIHKTSLLQLRVERIEAQCSKVYEDEVAKEHALTVVRKNLERMLQAQASVNQLYTDISESISTSSESSLSAEISELKKSQDALGKAIEKRESDLVLVGREIQGELMVAESPAELSENELQSLVQVVMCEEQQQ